MNCQWPKCGCAEREQCKPEDALKARITALESENKALRERVNELWWGLKNLLDDTQHAEHDCGDEEWCPVIRARALLAKGDGE